MASTSKADLTKELAEKTGTSQKDVETLTHGMLESIMDEIGYVHPSTLCELAM